MALKSEESENLNIRKFSLAIVYSNIERSLKHKSNEQQWIIRFKQPHSKTIIIIFEWCLVDFQT